MDRMCRPGVVDFLSPSPNGADWDAFGEEEKDALRGVNQRVAAGENLGAIMDFVFDATRDICPCDRLGLAFLEGGNGRMVSHYARALYEPVLLREGYAQDLGRSSLRGVMDSGHIRLIHDLEAYGRDNPDSESTRLLLKEGVASSMTCPLIVDGRRVGVLFRSSRCVGSYSERQSQIFLAVSERLSQAVEKAWQIQELERAKNAYAEMLGFVAHELKSPLSSLSMDGYALLGGYLGELEEKQKAKIEGMMKKAGFLLDLIQDYLTLSRIEQGDLRPEKERLELLPKVVEPVLEMQSAAISEKEMEVTCRGFEQGASVEADPSLLLIVMNNLVNNAVKYGVRGGRIEISADTNSESVVLSVWNEGPGFSPEKKSLLFRRFSRLGTQTDSRQKSTGVGLYTTWRIIQAHGGRIWAESKPDEGASFSFVLPG